MLCVFTRNNSLDTFLNNMKSNGEFEKIVQEAKTECCKFPPSLGRGGKLGVNELLALPQKPRQVLKARIDAEEVLATQIDSFIDRMAVTEFSPMGKLLDVVYGDNQSTHSLSVRSYGHLKMYISGSLLLKFHDV